MRGKVTSMKSVRHLACMLALSGLTVLLLASPALGAAVPGATYHGEAPGVGNETISFEVSGDGTRIASVTFPTPIEAIGPEANCYVAPYETFYFPAPALPISGNYFGVEFIVYSEEEEETEEGEGARLVWEGEFDGTQTAVGVIELYNEEVGCDSGAMYWNASTTSLPPSPLPPTPVVPGPTPQMSLPGTSGSSSGRGTAVAGGVAVVKGGKAQLRLRCPGRDPCKGLAALWVSGFKDVLLGKARFSVPAGKSRTVRVKLTSKGKRLLRKARRHRLRAKLKGRGVKKRTVLLKQK